MYSEVTNMKMKITKRGDVYKKGDYSGYIGETSGNGRKYGYHINLAKFSKNYTAPKSNYKKKSDAVKAIKTWLNKMQY